MLEEQDILKAEYRREMFGVLENTSKEKSFKVITPKLFLDLSDGEAEVKEIYIGTDEDYDDDQAIMLTLKHKSGNITHPNLIEDFGIDDIHKVYEKLYYGNWQ